jgi:hypothetical protein
MPIDLMRREPNPPRNQPAPGPTVPLDHEILRIMRDGVERELSSIRMAMADKPSTHNLHARMVVLVGKGLVERIPTPEGPRRGPGASKYRLARYE